jgi:hypothetical protein
MQNVEVKVEKKVMTLTIDLTKSFGPSKSGKTEIIATTNGNVQIGDVTIGVNVYRKK